MTHTNESSELHRDKLELYTYMQYLPFFPLGVESVYYLEHRRNASSLLEARLNLGKHLLGCLFYKAMVWGKKNPLSGSYFSPMDYGGNVGDLLVWK